MKRMTLTAAGLALGLSAPLAQAMTCDEATGLSVDGVTITGAVAQAEGDGLPAHCIVTGEMGRRTGADGRDYALRFELRLPDDWSGRFLHQFNGGNDGAVRPALGMWDNLPAGAGALARGMAVVSSDAGHDGEANPDAGLAGSNVFGQDFEARRMYGYGAVAVLHPAALALTEAYYGRAPDYVYGAGVSNGGRHAMVAAERMPGAFDGLLAGFPGFNLPRAALQHALDVQSFRKVGPSLAESFSPDELAIVAARINATCDGLDGLEDGMVFDLNGCQAAFDPASMICAEGQNSDCLPADKVAALETIYAGPRDAGGRKLYADWAWDPGIASGNWRFWKLESPIPPWDHKPLIAVMGAGSLSQIFTTPPTPVEGSPDKLEDFLMGFDIAAEAGKIDAISEAFPESPMQVMTPPDADNPTLAGMQEAGGKLVVFHGQGDPVFSILDTTAWYDRLMANNPGAAEFVRFYAIPGMPHGTGGNAADQVDILGALTDWVEKGEAPGALTALVRADNEEAAANAGAERLLCPYPGFAKYTGSDPASADSFACQ